MTSGRELELTGGHLRVRFEHRQDRFAHEIWWDDGRDWKRALVSVEGSPDDDWPASPPLQSLDHQRHDGRRMTLAVGMAGKSHWSASIEIDDTGTAALFDVACRVRGEDRGWLGNSYQLADDAQIERTGDGRVEVRFPASRAILVLELLPTETARITTSDNRLRIEALARNSSQSAQTIRWQYRARLVDRSETG